MVLHANTTQAESLRCACWDKVYALWEHFSWVQAQLHSHVQHFHRNFLLTQIPSKHKINSTDIFFFTSSSHRGAIGSPKFPCTKYVEHCPLFCVPCILQILHYNFFISFLSIQPSIWTEKMNMHIAINLAHCLLLLQPFMHPWPFPLWISSHAVLAYDWLLTPATRNSHFKNIVCILQHCL